MRISDWSSDVCSSDLRPGNVIHLSNLCTEILEVTSAEETAVCNLGSINLSHHVDEDGPAGTSVFDYDKLGETVRLAVRQLDRVIDLNFYPIRSEEHTSELQSLMRISYAVFCLKKKKNNTRKHTL